MNFLFTNVNEDLKKKYLKHINIKSKTYFRNELIISKDFICDHIGFINSGSVVVKKVFRDNHETPLKFLGKNDTFGHDIIFSKNKMYNYNLYSNSHTNISFISLDDLNYLMSSSSVFSFNILNLMSKELIKANNEVKVFKHDNLFSRVCEYFYIQYLNNKSHNFTINLNKTQLAEFFNTSRTLLSKQIKYLSDNEIVKNVGYSYFICDFNKLECHVYKSK